MSATNGPKKIERDHYLFREGDPPDSMYVVKSGKFAVVKTKQTSEIVLAEIGPGAMVGEMAFFDNKPRSASVKALKDSEVIALPYKALHAQFQSFPEWCKAIMRTVNDHLRNANQRIKQLERNETDDDLFPPHTMNKLVAILNFVGHRYGKPSEDKKSLTINGYLLRNYTIQIFQEAAHKMQKLLETLEGLKMVKIEDLGEGRQQIINHQPDFLFSFVDWHNEWLFKKESDRTLIKENELKLLTGLLHFAKQLTENDKGMVALNLTQVQNDSMKEIGFVIKPEETLCLVEKKLIGDHTIGDDKQIMSSFSPDELDKVTPYWQIIYALGKVKR
ncbi:MAG: porin [Bdellovibrio sp. CG10_big_fil_rev_8_21_14_0_10_47_8]|nr:MAG: porin [Bdellovibrio sp. CG10_big_fil_rev_8_21_14_0_10_47_8]